MAVNDEMVMRVAKLARIALDPADAPALAGELGKILDWIDQLQAVDTSGVEPMNAVIAKPHRWREDVVADGGIADQVLANAPAAAHGFFAVPKVVE